MPDSSSQRYALLNTLNRLPLPTFEALRYVVGAPRDVLPGDAAPQGSRGVALLEWVESPLGPGLPRLQQTLKEIVATESIAIPETISAVSEPQHSVLEPRSRIFLSYKRGSEPDELVALMLYEALKFQHSVFTSPAVAVGNRWVDQINAL